MESRPGRQRAWAVGLLALGGLFVALAHDHGGLTTDRGAAFLLGLMLAGLGTLGVLAVSRQTVTVDPSARRITITDAGHLRHRERVIGFAEVERVACEYLGTPTDGVNFHFLSLHLRGGGRVTLFGPGRFFPGGCDRAQVAAWRVRLEEMLATAPRPRAPASAPWEQTSGVVPPRA